MNETAAEKLRRAAKLMRECAEEATAGPWKAVAGTWQNETFAAVLGPDGGPGNPETWLMATGRGAVSKKADARQAATMHPGVTLAVADLLCKMARVDEIDPEMFGADVHGKAIAIACIYLGEEMA